MLLTMWLIWKMAFSQISSIVIEHLVLVGNTNLSGKVNGKGEKGSPLCLLPFPLYLKSISYICNLNVQQLIKCTQRIRAFYSNRLSCSDQRLRLYVF
jgi:hypothetical protein